MFWIITLLEVLALIFIPYFVGKLFWGLVEKDWNVSFGLCWGMGMAWCFVIFLLLLLFYLLWCMFGLTIINFNMQIVEYLEGVL